MAGERLPLCLVIIGGSGELGQAVVRACLDGTAEQFAGQPVHVVATYSNNNASKEYAGVEWVQLDTANHERVTSMLAELTETYRVAAVVYCAVPKHHGAATNDVTSLRQGIVCDVKNAAIAARKTHARFLVLCSDQVWDGRQNKLYTEEDAPTPCNAYGQAKAEMEREVLNLDMPAVVARTSLILTVRPTVGKAVRFVLDALEKTSSKPMVVFTDEPRNMSFSEDLAAALLELALASDFAGVINLAAPEILNRYRLAELLVQYGITLTGSMDNVTPGLSALSGLNRPLDVSMDVSLLACTLRHTRIRGVSEYLEQVCGSRQAA